VPSIATETLDAFDARSPEEARQIRPPRGFAWVYNRRTDQAEFPYDGRYYRVPGHAAILLPDVVARHGRKRTVEKIDYTHKRIQRTLAVLYHPSFGEQDDPEFGVPLDTPKPIEIVDRGSDDNLLGVKSLDEKGRPVPTHAKPINVTGAAVGPGLVESLL